MVEAITPFLLPIPGMVIGIQREDSKMASMISKTTNITVKVLAEINRWMGELRTTVLQNRAPIIICCLSIILIIKFPGMCCFNVSDFPILFIIITLMICIKK